MRSSLSVSLMAILLLLGVPSQAKSTANVSCDRTAVYTTNGPVLLTRSRPLGGTIVTVVAVRPDFRYWGSRYASPDEGFYIGYQVDSSQEVYVLPGAGSTILFRTGHLRAGTHRIVVDAESDGHVYQRRIACLSISR